MKKELILLIIIISTTAQCISNPLEIPLYNVHEITFYSKNYTFKDNPVRDVVLLTRWKHESGLSLKIYGYYDGDGKGGRGGNVFKIRFTPIKTGIWKLVSVVSNDMRLNSQKAGTELKCVPSEKKGFWLPDPNHSSGRWYRRSDGSHPYIIGNTMYSFLSETVKDQPNGSSIKRDIAESSMYFNKLRLAVGADINPNPTDKPFLDTDGKSTTDGKWSHRPNPHWFIHRVDKAVQLLLEQDVIADLILNGPDLVVSRNILRASENGGDIVPFLRYVTARYGSYPNVWFCLSNEYDIRNPKYTPQEISVLGQLMRTFMAYPSPLSVHASQADWNPKLNIIPAWNDHVIIQFKLKTLPEACDVSLRNFRLGRSCMPVINDELAYQGKGDGWSEEDLIEAFLGAFAGGSYASSAYKSGNKKGTYFEGNFDAEEHSAAAKLCWMKNKIEEHIDFWMMQPLQIYESGDFTINIFRDGRPSSRILACPDSEYVLATNRSGRVSVFLPDGSWTIRSFNIINTTEKIVATDAQGNFQIRAPSSRAVLWHFKKNNYL